MERQLDKRANTVLKIVGARKGMGGRTSALRQNTPGAQKVGTSDGLQSRRSEGSIPSAPVNDIEALKEVMLEDLEQAGYRTEQNGRESMPLWFGDYYSAICTLIFERNHIELIISYERSIDPTCPNPHQFFEYCNPAFPDNLYDTIWARTKLVMNNRPFVVMGRRKVQGLAHDKRIVRVRSGFDAT